MLHRSFLYAPGSKQRVMRKALTAGADAVIFDLEDAVAAEEKANARDAVAAMVRDAGAGARSSLHVRINRDADGFSDADARAVVLPGLSALRLPKCDAAAPIARLDELIVALEEAGGIPAGTIKFYPTVESAAGVLAAHEVARASGRVAALVFGPADFLADLGLAGTSLWDATLTARSTLVLASRAAGLGPPVDGAFTDLDDLAGLRSVTERARDLGFFGKTAIHPGQLPVLHEVFTPSPQQVQRALRVVASLGSGGGTAVVDGEFVDPAVVAQARAVLALAERTATRGANR